MKGNVIGFDNKNAGNIDLSDAIFGVYVDTIVPASFFVLNCI